MIYFYDLEIFPNFFCVTFLGEKEEKQYFLCFENENIDQRENLKFFLRQKSLTLVGFNNYNFDNPIINALAFKGYTVEKVYKLAQGIVNSSGVPPDFPDYYDLRKMSPYTSIDLQRLLGLDLITNLKQVAIKLRWPLIQDLPLPFDRLIVREDIPKILKYNENDCGITRKLYYDQIKEVELRENLSQQYNQDFRSDNDSRLANVLLEKFYSQEVNSNDFKDKRTKRKEVKFSHCISKDIEFQTPVLKALFNELLSVVVDTSEGRSSFKKKVNFADTIFNFGVGGLHTEDLPGTFETVNGNTIIDADVASFYPNIILRNNIKPWHLEECFLRIYQKMTKERLEAKKVKDKTKADSFKIVINSIFGKLGSVDSWLYDPQAFLSVTLNGQLYLLMLAEELYLAGIKVLSANTDGIVASVSRSKTESYYESCNNWIEKTTFPLEYSVYKKYIRRDVNNYISEKVSGDIKQKGIFEEKQEIRKGYPMPILAYALKEYFINGREIEDIVYSCSDPYMFFLSQKVGHNFDTFLKRSKGEVKLQKNNRYYAAKKNGGMLVKRRRSDKQEIQILSHYAAIANEVTGNELENIEKQYYVNEIKKVIEVIKPEYQKEILF